MMEERVPQPPPDLHMTAPVARVCSNLVNGIETFPVAAT
jgi:hypothetical protein